MKWHIIVGLALLLTACHTVLASEASEETQPVDEQLRGRRLGSLSGTTNTGTQKTSLSGTPVGSGGGSSSSDSSSGAKSIDHVWFGGNHQYTYAPLGIAGGEYLFYMISCFFMLIYAWFYKMYVVNPIAPMPKVVSGDVADDFDVGVCDCWFDTCMCCHLIFPCCIFVRQAHTNEVTGICSYWATFWSYALTGMCCCIGPFCLSVYFRMLLKEHMMIEDHVLNDLCLAWLCLPCSVGQQALAVDRALGYDVELCCNLQWRKEIENADGSGGYYNPDPMQDPLGERRYEQGYDPRY